MRRCSVRGTLIAFKSSGHQFISLAASSLSSCHPISFPPGKALNDQIPRSFFLASLIVFLDDMLAVATHAHGFLRCSDKWLATNTDISRSTSSLYRSFFFTNLTLFFTSHHDPPLRFVLYKDATASPYTGSAGRKTHEESLSFPCHHITLAAIAAHRVSPTQCAAGRQSLTDGAREGVTL